MLTPMNNPLCDPLVAEYYERKVTKKCGERFIKKMCKSNPEHQFVKALFCGREWCDICGSKGSCIHKRRMARVIPYVMQLGCPVGYYVFTIPEMLRHHFRNKENLGKLRRGIHKILKKYGYDKGVGRFHWYGEKSNSWNPHYNVLVGGWYAVFLDGIKSDYAKLLSKITREPVKTVIVNYQYSVTKGQLYHWIEYITRATALKEKTKNDLGVKKLIYGFKNVVYWGEFKKVKDMNEAEVNQLLWDIMNEAISGIGKETFLLSNNRCPECYGELESYKCYEFKDGEWKKVLKIFDITKEKVKTIQDYGGGFSRIEPKHW